MTGILFLAWKLASGFFTGLFNFFTTKPGCYIGIALLFVGAFWWHGNASYNRGVADITAKHKLEDEVALRVATELVRKEERARAALTHKADVAWAKAHPQIITVTNTVYRSIPGHVTEAVDRDFPVPCGLVRVWDAATLSVDPGSLSYGTGLADDTPCPVKASALAGAGVSAIRGYIEVTAQLTALQGWIRDQANYKMSGRLEGADLQVEKVDGKSASKQPDQHDAEHVTIAHRTTYVRHTNVNGAY